MTRPLAIAAAAAALVLAAAAAHAQLDGFIAPDIPPLDAGPLHERIALERPILAAAIAAGAGLVIAWILRSRGQTRPALITAAAGLAAAALLFAAGTLVTTEREVLRERTRAIIAATAAADTDTLVPLLHPQARIVLPPPIETMVRADDRDKVVAAVETYLGRRYTVASHRVREVQAQTDGPATARTQVAVTANGETGGPVGSWWLIRWRKHPDDGWQATQLDLLHLPLAGVSFGG